MKKVEVKSFIVKHKPISYEIINIPKPSPHKIIYGFRPIPKVSKARRIAYSEFAKDRHLTALINNLENYENVRRNNLNSLRNSLNKQNTKKIIALHMLSEISRVSNINIERLKKS